jgi:hypothetical protein
MKKHKAKPLEIRAAVTGWSNIEAAEGEEKKLRRFTMTAYTGDAMVLAGWPYPVIVDLKGLKISAKSRPILKDHRSSLIVGHTDSVSKESGALKVAGVISGAGQVAQEVIASSENGFPWQASIGAVVQKVVFVPEGKQARANGRVFDGPVYVARKATLGEVSFVALGADDETSARIAASVVNKEMETINMEFEQWVEAQGFIFADLEEKQTKSLKALYEAQQNKSVEANDTDDTDDQPDVVSDIRAEVAAETKRLAAVRKVCAGKNDEIEAQAISEGWDEAKTELAVLRAERPQAPAINGNSDTPTGQTLEAAVCMAAGLEDIDKKYSDQVLEAADKRFNGQIGLQDLLIEAARMSGYTGWNFRSDMRGVLEAAFSTLSLPGILSNVANKFLLEGFEGVESTWRALSAIRNVRDFKQVTSYRLTGGFQYEQVGPDGELKHAELGEEAYTNQAQTYGRMFSLTRHDLINDDLGALTAVPRRLGRGAALKLNDVFWNAFLNNASFFSTANNNYADGAATALAIDSLTQAEQMFLDLVDPDGHPLAVSPAVLLVPNALLVTGSNLMNSTEVREDGNTSKSKYVTNNPHSGKFRVVRSSYLSNAKYAGSSNKAWYVLAEPNDMPVIEVAFLNGQQRPTVESADADFNVLGIQMRGYHDFGVALQEFRGGVKMKGEA